MAGQTSKENGKKGGRPKGFAAKNAEEGKKLLIAMYLENIKPINEALLNKAREGDMQAIKELHDRVYGRPPQPLTGPQGGNIVFEFIKYNDNQSNLPPQVPTA